MRHSVMIVGTGGMGALTIGRLLLEAGLPRYAHTTWFPSYDTRQRGGPAECTVILAADEIWSPVRFELEALVMMHISQLPRFRERVVPGGLAIVERGCSLGRAEVRELEIPAEETARGVGSVATSNQVFLGAYVAASGCLPPEAVEAALQQRYGRQEDVLALNVRAFREGLRLGASG